MNELTGKYVNVVLAVEEGKGMEFTKNPINIVANFNGRILESDFAQPEECPVFNTELVWETEKRDLRKIRSSNIPLRIECFTSDSQQRKERIGFALLCVRSANIIPLSAGKTEIPFKWHKLLGVPNEFKSKHPELYLSLSIRDYFFNQDIPPNMPVESFPSQETIMEETESLLEDSQASEMKDAKVIPVRYLQDGFIQIGPNSQESKIFYLYITVKVASNLDVLLPEVLVFNQNKEKYFISFTIFGITINSKPFYKDLHDQIPLNEKIVIRLISCFDILKAFFAEFSQVMANFHSGHDKLGKSKINVQELVPDISEDEFENNHSFKLSLKQRCFFNFPSPNGIVPESLDGRKPFIDVEVMLEHKPNAKMTEGELGEVNASQLSDRSRIKKVLSCLNKNIEKASGDQPDKYNTIDLEGITKKDEKAQSDHNFSPRPDVIGTHSADTVLKHVPLLKVDTPKSARSPRITEIIKPSDMYQQYFLDIIIQNISWKKPLKLKHSLIRFKHPRASTSVTLNCNLDGSSDNILEDLRCKLYFIAKPDQIRPMIYNWPPKITIYDEKETKLTEECDLYTAMFLAKDKQKSSYITELNACRTFEPLVKLNITMFLEECELKLFKPSPTDLMPPLLDEVIAIKEINDIQEWKLTQKTQFLETLKVLEAKRMAELQKEWNDKKIELERKLGKSVKRCKALSEELHTAAETLRKQKELEEKKKQIHHKNCKEMEDAVEKALSRYSAADNVQLLEKISNLEAENISLKQVIKEQQEEIQMERKSALTKEQTTNLLQELRVLEEKFEDAKKAKSYFKDQWKNAVREIHELRSEDQKQLKTQIQLNKEALSQLSLDEFFNSANADDFEIPIDDLPKFGGII